MRTLGIAFTLLGLSAVTALAQVGPGGAINPGRDCQTIRECRFTTGGVYRGCISSFSCRLCRMVQSKCTISGREQVCQRVKCDWGA